MSSVALFAILGLEYTFLYIDFEIPSHEKWTMCVIEKKVRIICG